MTVNVLSTWELPDVAVKVSVAVRLAPEEFAAKDMASVVEPAVPVVGLAVSQEALEVTFHDVFAIIPTLLLDAEDAVYHVYEVVDVITSAGVAGEVDESVYAPRPVPETCT